MPHLPDHATHDPELIAAYAAGDVTGPSLADATELVAQCADCAVLHRDLRAIAVALPALPAPVRPRDFRLTPEQAASLAPSGWRGVLAAFASPRFRLAAPLGTGLAAIGLAGLLLGTPGSLHPAGGAGTPAEAGTGATSAPAAAADGAAGAAGAAAAAPALPPAPSNGAAYGDTGSLAAEPVPVAAAAASAVAAGPAAASEAPAAGIDIAGAAPAASPVPGSTAERELALQAPSPASSGGDSIGVPRPAPQAPVAEPGPSPWLAISAVLLVVGVTLVVLRLAARWGDRA